MVVEVSVPPDVSKLYEGLRDIFVGEDLSLRHTTNAIFKDEKWWEIALIRDGYEAMLHVDGTNFKFSEKSCAQAEYELEYIFYFKAKEA